MVFRALSDLHEIWLVNGFWWIMLSTKASWAFSESACSHFFICLLFFSFLLSLHFLFQVSWCFLTCLFLSDCLACCFFFPFLLFLHRFCVRVSFGCCGVWVVPPRNRWRGVCSCRTLWLSGSGIRRHPRLLNRLKSPSQPAVWYVEACRYMTD